MKGGGIRRGDAIGRFLLLEHIGQGGMGTVFAAWDPKLGRRVALKVLRGDPAATESARILREARALAQLTHPNVVRVYELGEINGVPFIAMELVEGSSLRDVTKGPLPEARLLDLFVQAGRGLAAVHGLGIVHRDFKPANVLVGRDGRVCVGDFGLAIAQGDEDSGGSKRSSSGEHTPSLSSEPVTLYGQVLGTPGYMAPEQLRAEVLDARCDQFSFGVSLWTALFKERPFPKDAPGPLFPPPPRPRRASWVGRAVEPVLRRALAMRRDDRYPSMLALLAALESARHRPQRRAVGAAVVAGVGLLAAVAVPRALDTDPCGVRARAASAFPASIRARLRPAAGTAHPLSDLGAHVDAYTAQWLTAAESVCRRPDVPNRAGVQACLDRRLGDLTALAAVLASHGDALDNALPAVLALPSPHGCLAAGPAHPVASASGAGSEMPLERRLADARAAWLAGRPADGLELARGVAVAAHATGDALLEAEAQHVVGVSAIDLGDLPTAEAALRAAVAGGMVTHAERLEALAWTDLLNLVGDRARRYDEAARLLPLERAAVTRVGEDLDVLVRARFAEAVLLADMGELAQATPLAVESVTLAERRVPHDPRIASRAHGNYGNLLVARGELDAGVGELEAAHRALEGAFPPGHTSFGAVDNNLGVVQVRLGDLPGARRSLERAAEIYGGSPRRPTLAVVLDNLGHVARMEGKADEARLDFERARQIAQDTWGPAHERTSNPMLGQALLLQDEGKWPEAAALLDEVIRIRVGQNPHTRPSLEALLAKATLTFERGAPAGQVAAAVAAVRAQLVDHDDLRGVRAELALHDAVLALESREVTKAQALLAEARAGAGFVEWFGFGALVTAWAELAEGRAPACATLAAHVPLARRLRARCR